MVAGRSWLKWSLLGAGAILLVGLGVVTFLSMAGGSPLTSSGGSQSLACRPKPCLDVQGYTLWVSDVSTADGVVRLWVKFRNASGSTHAAPEDLVLVDSNRQISPSIQDASGCTHWSRTEFSGGASYGPITVCFRPASIDPPLTLRWSPDMGLFCCQADLRIK